MAGLPARPGLAGGETVVHRLPAHVKVVALVAFVLAVVAVPSRSVWPFGVDLAVVAAVAVLARMPAGFAGRGLIIETPFLIFALLLPFVATGPTTTLLGLTVSEAGLWGAWTLVAKGTLGVLAALTLAATTTPVALLAGLRRLRLPTQLVDILGFMIRYLDVVLEQWRRMGVARASRAFVATSPVSWPALGRSLGTLFIHSYERGERVHLAMLSRGYTGTMPAAVQPASQEASARTWAVAALAPAAALLAAALARALA